METLKKITYKAFVEKFGNEYGNSLRPEKAKEIAKKHGFKIADMHNIVDDAKSDNRI